MILPKLLLVILLIGCAVYSTYATTYPSIGTCFRNCTQCKKLLGIYFDLQLCDDYCVKFRGKMAPVIDDLDTLAPFITNFNEVQ